MKKTFILFLLLTIASQAEALKVWKVLPALQKTSDNSRSIHSPQLLSDTTEVKIEGDVFTAVEEMPYYPKGRDKGFQKYLNANVRFPPQARGKVAGKVYVTFVVLKSDGRIVNPKILQGLGFGCDEEAIRLIRNATPWVPGKQRGIKVHVRYTVPVSFFP